MPELHNLFYSSNPDTRTLHRNIIPSEKQQAMQQERWNDLRDYLVYDLGDVSGCKITSWLQGSYKFGTQVRPARKKDEFDIDLGIYFGWDGNLEDGSFSSNNLKSFVQGSLLRYKKEAGDDVLEVVDPPKERCSRMRFPGNFHIDIPSYHLDEKSSERSLATETHGWEDSDPVAFYEWFRGLFSDEKSFQARRIIRYLKVWAQLNMKQSPASVLLTVLVAEAFIEFAEDQTKGDDIALRDTAQYIADRLSKNSDVKNPVNKKESLNRSTNNEIAEFISGLHRLIAVANEALSAKTEIAASSIWSVIFHHFFPFPVLDQSNPNSRALVPVKFEPKILVIATSEENAHIPAFKDYNRIGPIPKKCEIKFILENFADLPLGSRVQWIVRNEGEEADFENDLGHFAGVDLQGADEHSAYKGTHYMDFTANSSFGEILGFCRIPVEVEGTFVPPRNPKKPGWVNLRLRRR